MPSPALTVLLPVWNAATSLDAALASLAGQKGDGFEVLVVDDGSTDDSRAIAQGWRARLPGLRVLERAHRGIQAALTDGLAHIDTPLVARMDADDIAHPQRLERQRAFLAEHPEIVLCGSHVRITSRGDGAAAGPGMERYGRWIAGICSPADVLRERFIECPIVHPTFCFRRDPVMKLGGYGQGDFAEDHELVLRMADAGAPMANVPEILLDWQDSETRLSRSHSAYSRPAFQGLRGRYLARHVGARPVLIFGAGKVGRSLARELQRNGTEVKGFVDIDPRKWGRVVRECEVHAPDFITGPREEMIVSAVGNLGARALIREHLVSIGCTEGPDFVMAA